MFGRDRGGQRDRLFDPPLVGASRPRRPLQIDQQHAVFALMLLELPDAQLAEPGRSPPVDPSQTVAVAILAQPVEVSLVMSQAVPAQATAQMGLLTLAHPAAGQPPNRGDDQQFVLLIQFHDAAYQP